jgi:hypothetical protein
MSATEDELMDRFMGQHFGRRAIDSGSPLVTPEPEPPAPVARREPQQDDEHVRRFVSQNFRGGRV